jgi:hypothetical protein
MKVLSIAIIFLGVLVFSCGGSLYADHLASTRPKSPQASLGLVLERNFHGSSVFISRNDMYTETSIHLFGMALLVAGALLFKRHTGEA